MRHAKVELSSAAGFSGLSVPQIGAGRKNWKDETFFFKEVKRGGMSDANDGQTD